MEFRDFHGCGCFDVKYVMGFFVWMLYTRFLPFNCKECMICEKREIRVHVFILGIWGFWWIWVVFIWTGSWVVVYACWWHVLYRLYTSFSHLGMHVGSFANLVLHGIWGFVELDIIAWNWPSSKLWWIGSHWFYTHCTMCSVGLHVFQITSHNGSIFIYFHKIDHFNAFIHALIVFMHHVVFFSCICTLCLCVSNAVLNIAFILSL